MSKPIDTPSSAREALGSAPTDPLGVSELVRLLLSTDALQDFLTELAVRAAGRINQSCGITVGGIRLAYTVASSDDLAAQLDELQYAHGSGPCLEALRSGERIVVTDMATEHRWGDYGPRAAALGARSSLSYPMRAGGTVLGALNLYATGAGGQDAELQAAAAHIADAAADAVGLAVRLARQAELTTNLQAALASRTVIDQAIGVMMGQQRCSAAEAFELIVKVSQNRNTKVRDVAAGIIAGIENRTAKDH